VLLVLSDGRGGAGAAAQRVAVVAARTGMHVINYFPSPLL
jgi:hypothetical protein